MPPYSSHLLQPLDVSYFSLLKRVYKQEIQKQIALSINYINKNEFLTIYSLVCTTALSKKNV
jgi:hypothetical protein